MWQLSVRDQNRQWTDIVTFGGIAPAARRVPQLEGEPGAEVFFRVYADPLMEKSDAEILSRLEYQGAKGFYVLRRQVQ